MIAKTSRRLTIGLATCLAASSLAMGAIASPATGASATPAVQPAAVAFHPRAAGLGDDTYYFVGRIYVDDTLGGRRANPASVAINAIDDTVYVANAWTGTVEAIAPGQTSGTPYASVSVIPPTAGQTKDIGLYGIAVDSNDDTVYVVNRGLNPKRLWAINGRTMTLDDTVTLSCDGDGHDTAAYRNIAVNSLDDTVYVPCDADGLNTQGRLYAVNGRNLDDSISVTSGSSLVYGGMYVDEATNRVFSGTWWSGAGTVEVRNGANLSSLPTTFSSGFDEPTSITKVDDTIYVTSFLTSQLLARNIATGTSSTVALRPGLTDWQAIAAFRDDSLIFVGSTDPNNTPYLTVLNTPGLTVSSENNSVAISSLVVSSTGLLYAGQNFADGYTYLGVNVYGQRPDAPTGAGGSPGNAQVTTSWTPPVDIGTSPILQYKVTASPGGASCTTSSTSCTISGLTNGTAYTFTVQAQNAAGWSPASAASAPVTPVAPAPPTPVANMQLTMASSPARFEKAGDVLTITATVLNNGTDTLNAVQVRQGSIPLTCAPVTPVATLGPGDSVVCRGTYTVTEEDADAAVVRDRVTATAVAGLSGSPLSASAVLTVQGPPPPERLQVRVVLTSSPSDFSRAGQKLNLSAMVTNLGNVAVRDLIITGSPVDFVCTPTPPVKSLAVKATVRCSGTYEVTRADMSAGAIRGLLRATGSSASGARVASTGIVEVARTSPERPSVKVKMASAPESFRRAGQSLTFTATVTNRGDVPLSNVSVIGTPAKLACTPSAPIGTLDVDATATCTGSYTVTQADMKAGFIKATSKVTGTSPRGSVTSDDESIRVRLDTTPRSGAPVHRLWGRFTAYS